VRLIPKSFGYFRALPVAGLAFFVFGRGFVVEKDVIGSCG
jgi:hypothetical protein